MTTSSPEVEYLEKYSVAPSPSRDYYGIKVIQEQVILYTWKISHGPHINPIVSISRFNDFNQDKTMHNEIQRVFGESMFRHVQTIAQGNEKTLLTLPKHLIQKLTTYLRLKDVLNLSKLSRMAKEVFNGDIVWEVLYRRQKMGLVYRDEKELGYSCGWKELFKERQLHKPSRERKEVKKKLTRDERLVTPRSSSALAKKIPNSLILQNSKSSKISTAVLIGTETKTPRFVGRPETAKKKQQDEVTKDSKLFSMKNVTSDDSEFDKTKNKPKESKKNVSDIFKSCEKHGNEDVIEDKTKSGVRGKYSYDEASFKNDNSAVSIIERRKNSDWKCASLIKKSAKLSDKRNPLRVKKIQSQDESSVARFGEKKRTTSRNKTTDSKSVKKCMMIKKVEKFSSQTNPSSENILAYDSRRNCNRESISNVEESSAEEFWKPMNSLNVRNKSTIYRKFSIPKKPTNPIKIPDDMSSASESSEISEKKFADIKIYLKSGNNNFSHDVPKLGDIGLDPNVKCSSTKKTSDNTTTSYKSQSFKKTESFDSLYKKITSIKSSRYLGAKKRPISKK